jgi:hypothetical protein
VYVSAVTCLLLAIMAGCSSCALLPTPCMVQVPKCASKRVAACVRCARMYTERMCFASSWYVILLFVG